MKLNDIMSTSDAEAPPSPNRLDKKDSMNTQLARRYLTFKLSVGSKY